MHNLRENQRKRRPSLERDREGEREKEIERIELDYLFFTRGGKEVKDESRLVTCLSGGSNQIQWPLFAMVPEKGQSKFAIAQVCHYLDMLCLDKADVRGDGEGPIQKLLKGVKQLRPICNPSGTPPYSSQSLGLAESTTQSTPVFSERGCCHCKSDTRTVKSMSTTQW